jgi:hypothetical protein
MIQVILRSETKFIHYISSRLRHVTNTYRGIQVLLVVLEVHKDLVVLERQLLLEIQESRADLFDPADPPDLRAPVVQINLEIQAGPLDLKHKFTLKFKPLMK